MSSSVLAMPTTDLPVKGPILWMEKQAKFLTATTEVHSKLAICSSTDLKVGNSSFGAAAAQGRLKCFV